MAKQQPYSHHARRALHHAAQLAEEYGHPRQDTAHLLVGVMLTEGSLGAEILEVFDFPVPVAKVYLKRLMNSEENIRKPVPKDESFQKTMEFASDEAGWLGSQHIGTEHMLLGITRTNLGNAINLLKLVDITPEQLRRRLRHVMSDGHFEWSLEMLRANARLSELSRRVLNAAEQRAVQLDHPIVDLGHLLVALANERRGPTQGFLSQSGFNVPKLKNEMDVPARFSFVSLESVLEEAMNQAEKLGSHYLGADHILLALSINPQASEMLTRFDVSVEKLRRILQKHLKE
jgi:ATP-dependent Clp protease ATP-binding subunit ClpA